jgi:hypothetical protein
LDAKQSHPVIYSIFLISTSLNSQHLNGGNAEGDSYGLPYSPTSLSGHTQKEPPSKVITIAQLLEV